MKFKFIAPIFFAAAMTFHPCAKSDEEVGKWKVVQDQGSNIPGDYSIWICFRYVVTNQTNSPVTTEGYFEPVIFSKGKGACEVGLLAIIDLANGVLYADNKQRFERLLYSNRKVTEFLDKSRAEYLEGKKKRDYQKYKSDFSAISMNSTIHDLRRFEEEYKNNDPDSLIGSLNSIKMGLEKDEYRKRFAAAKTSADFRAFIKDYRGASLDDGLVDKAKIGLDQALEREQKEWAATERAAEEGRRLKNVAMYEQSISNCKASIKDSMERINQERRIAAISGYENKSALYRSGMAIDTCQSVIQSSYESYKKYGGTKKLANIE